MSKIIVIILLHILGDSLLLTKKLRKLKIEKVSFLFLHVGIYILPFIVLSPIILGLTFLQGLEFSILIGIVHFVVDFTITQIKKRYWRTHKYQYVVIASLFEHLLQVSVVIFLYLNLFPNNINIDNWHNIVRYFFFEKPV